MTAELLIKHPNKLGCTVDEAIYHMGSNVTFSDMNMTKLIQNFRCYFNPEENSEIEAFCKSIPRCHEVKYSYTVHQSPWPNDVYILQFYCEFIDPVFCWGDDWIFTPISGLPNKTAKHFNDYRSIYHTSFTNETLAFEMLQTLHLLKGNMIAKNFIQLKVLFAVSMAL